MQTHSLFISETSFKKNSYFSDGGTCQHFHSTTDEEDFAKFCRGNEAEAKRFLETQFRSNPKHAREIKSWVDDEVEDVIVAYKEKKPAAFGVQLQDASIKFTALAWVFNQCGHNVSFERKTLGY